MSKAGKIAVGSLCARVTSGGTPSTKHPEYYGGTIPWLRTQEVDFKPIYDTEIHITDLGLENSSAKWIPANSVIVAMYGATAGRIAIAKVPLTTNQACCNLIVDPQKADYRYVYYALMHETDGEAIENLIADEDVEATCPDEMDIRQFRNSKTLRAERFAAAVGVGWRPSKKTCDAFDELFNCLDAYLNQIGER